MNKSDILRWLRTTDEAQLADLWLRADETRRACVGNEIHLRGIVEVSNRCRRDCLYCGINIHAAGLRRYSMESAEILDIVRNFTIFSINTVVLQAGESPHLTREWVADLTRRINNDCGLAVSLSLGEREPEDFLAWKEAGADRYLLKFETSNPDLFARLHPAKPQGWQTRIESLKTLNDLGYEVGSGVMIGLPGQTYNDLANDILLFRELDIDMIGVGPYIPHPDTDLGGCLEAFRAIADQVPNDDLMTYKAVALIRLVRPYANIPSTTALSTVDPAMGRELALRRGANVIMPDFTPLKYRVLYDIYPKIKPTTDEIAPVTQGVMDLITQIGRTVGRGEGISKNFLRRLTADLVD